LSSAFAPDSIPNYAQVLLPIAIAQHYTYSIPSGMATSLQVGMRVEVQFGKSKLYTGIVAGFIDKINPQIKPKAILSILDMAPMVSEQQLQLWTWIADYYACTIGEVMNAALPGKLKLNSDSKVFLSPTFDHNMQGLSDKEFLIVEALIIQKEISMSDIQSILAQKSITKLINKLIEKRLIFVRQILKTKYKPKIVDCVRFTQAYQEYPELLNEAFELTSKSEKQTNALLAFVQLQKSNKFVRKTDIYKTAKIDTSVIKAMVKKGIFEVYPRTVSRIESEDVNVDELPPLTEQQQAVMPIIKSSFAENKPILLHGVTGSGKTRVYVECMKEIIAKGGQVLYLLPEIALTTQIINRLKKLFGNDILVYHSKMNDDQRVEIFEVARKEGKIFLGARSSIFLPFRQLDLIVVDEEHDPSFKQYEPAPRYNARDTALYMSKLYDAKIILGTATPSIETYTNALSGKYNLAELTERFAGLAMPEIIIVDKKREIAQNKIKGQFTSVLIDEIQSALDKKEQIILFQNRRGYAPTISCDVCAWKMECNNCDVSLTYHKYTHKMHCHYCASRHTLPEECPACGNKHLEEKGYGTAKIEDEIISFFPTATVGRMDFDTVNTRAAYEDLLMDFEDRQIDILVGTQMITKGLDFDNVSVVGVLNADQQFAYPDFRSTERGFQLILQVSGRAGRKNKQGKVIIQTFNPTHPVLEDIIAYDYSHFYHREIFERKEAAYPPVSRMIKVTLKHKKVQNLKDATLFFDHLIRPTLGERLNGPASPYVGRIRSYFLMDFWIKLENKAAVLKSTKSLLHTAAAQVKASPGASQLRVVIDVDPY